MVAGLVWRACTAWGGKSDRSQYSRKILFVTFNLHATAHLNDRLLPMRLQYKTSLLLLCLRLCFSARSVSSFFYLCLCCFMRFNHHGRLDWALHFALLREIKKVGDCSTPMLLEKSLVQTLTFRQLMPSAKCIWSCAGIQLEQCIFLLFGADIFVVLASSPRSQSNKSVIRPLNFCLDLFPYILWKNCLAFLSI